MNVLLRIALVFILVVCLSGALISCAGHSKKTTKEDAPQHSGHGGGHQH
jgi:hypothetical protein